MTQVKFPEFIKEKNDLYERWLSRVNDYFTKNKISKFDNFSYYLKFFILTISWLSVWILLTFFSRSYITSIPLSICLGICTAILGINSMHDGGHGSVSKYRIINKCFAFMSDILGGSSFIWNIKHNVLHHTYTNLEDLDDDLSAGVIARLGYEQRKSVIHKYQHIYMFPVYSFLTLKWTFFDDFVNFYTKKVGAKSFDLNRSQILLFLIGRFVHFSLIFLIPSIFHSWSVVFVNVLMCYLFSGFVTAIIFAVAHMVEDLAFFKHEPKLGFFEHQLATTADFSRESSLALFISGGLNYQTVHHLTPNVNHMHYPALSKELEAFCCEHELVYHHFPTYWEALKSHYRFLKRMGNE